MVAAGKATTAGDAVIRANALRARGLTGSGVRIGVISDGVGGLAAARASGDLGEVRVLSNEQGGNEGTAMLEIVYDIAPGAELYFHDHGDSVLGFNRAVDDLVAAGCTVIVDDVAWPREPFFEDGVIATHLEGLLASQKLVYVSATGNYRRRSGTRSASRRASARRRTRRAATPRRPRAPAPSAPPSRPLADTLGGSVALGNFFVESRKSSLSNRCAMRIVEWKSRSF